MPAGTGTAKSTLRQTVVTKALMSGEGASAEQMAVVLKFRALKTELDIFQTANSQLVGYALALEEELIEKEAAGSVGSGALSATSPSGKALQVSFGLRFVTSEWTLVWTLGLDFGGA